ncbi:hypothetical protein [Methanolacinia petrolearia]|uniref:hypothetical protein n=1 Tax=Methanolacinia petrolearia TaxID=54120 RepID=UPI003BA96CA5
MEIVRRWPYEKQMKWLIALGLIVENQRKAVQDASKHKKDDWEIYILEDDRIVHYS